MTGEIDIPVLIVGGGGAGLSASNILADLGVQSLLIERHPSTAHLPKAHYLNQRTMEIFRHHRLANEVYAKAAPRANLGKMVWCTSFGGDGPLDRKTIAIVDALGGGELAGMYDLKGVTPPTNIPQIRLEPVLARTAAQRNPDGVLFEHELVSLHERDGHVDAKALNRATGKELSVRAQYVIGADGGKTIGPMFGVQMIGPTNMRDLVTFYVKADFSEYITDDLSVMRVIMNPDEIGTAQYLGAALAYGPEHWDRRSEEWGIVWAYDLNDPQRHDKASGVELIKRFLKVDVPIEIKRVSHWTLEVVVADRFRIGERVFLAGDAAHRQPPAAGLGMNSGIQDVHNLCWKLAYVLKGVAPSALLDSYEPERRPVIERNAEWANFSWMSNATLHSAMGFVNGAPQEYNRAVLQKLLSDTADGASRRAYMYEVLDTARVEFAVHDLEMGFTYARGAVIDDGRPFPPRDPMGHEYTPSTRPGCRLPHAWLRVGEQTLSTHDLLPHGGFLLLTGAGGAAWCAAAARLAADLNIPIRAVRIGAGKECEASDPSGIWAGVCGISPSGAVLVRPDGHVAYRAEQEVAAAAAGALRTALENVLSSASLGR